MADIATSILEVGSNRLILQDAEARTKINDMYITDTASGAIASFPDGADNVPVKSLTVDIEPVQSGSGDPSPSNVRPISGWTQAKVTRTGVNIWDEQWEQGEFNTNTGANYPSTTRCRSKDYIPIEPSASYYFNSPNGVAAYLLFYNKDKNYIGFYGSSITGTRTFVPENLSNAISGGASFSTARYMRFRYDAASISAESISINYPSTDTAYHSGADNETYTIDLDGTRYGGTLNVETGVLTVTHAFYTINGQYTINKHSATAFDAYYMELPRNGLPRCASTQDGTVGQFNMFRLGKLSDGNGCAFVGADTVQFRKDGGGTGAEMKAWLVNNPLQVVYPLATPQTVQLTVNEISTVLGQNNVWNDCGDTTIEYRADTKLYINKVLNA